MRILVVEDELELKDSIVEGLQLEGYAVDSCSNGIDAYEHLSVEEYDLAILDLNLPGMDGMDVLKKLRESNLDIKVLILSARTSVDDKVDGLDYGANDYLTKPFDFAELEARIRSLLRRQYKSLNSTITHNDISIDLVNKSIKLNDEKLNVTNKEFEILRYFMLNINKLISQEELIDHIWDSKSNSFSGAIRVHMASLRKKLRSHLGYDPIQTRIGQGYILTEDKVYVE